ncbi:MAG: flavin reductase family protein [Dehalococcoidia bacterium]
MDPELFRQAWGNFATGVCIVNTLEENGAIHGMTANGVASISLDPMLVMVSVAHKANTYPIMKKTQRYVINILSESQKDVAMEYAKKVKPDDFNLDDQYVFTSSGMPFLKNSLASMECDVVNMHKEGDHTIFIGEVKDIVVADGPPLLFFKGDWAKFDI